MKRTYEIHPPPADIGGGWKLALLEDGQEAGGGYSRFRKMIRTRV